MILLNPSQSWVPMLVLIPSYWKPCQEEEGICHELSLQKIIKSLLRAPTFLWKKKLVVYIQDMFSPLPLQIVLASPCIFPQIMRSAPWYEFTMLTVVCSQGYWIPWCSVKILTFFLQSIMVYWTRESSKVKVQLCCTAEKNCVVSKFL